MFTLEGPHIVMSRTDVQNGLDFRNVRYEKFPVSVYRKNYTDIIGIPVFL
jgi:hypothetical protein